MRMRTQGRRMPDPQRGAGTEYQTAPLAAITTALRELLMVQTGPVLLAVTAGALGTLARSPALALTVAAEVTRANADVLKQLGRRLSELEVIAGTASMGWYILMTTRRADVCLCAGGGQGR
jgi:hypothetical protein